MTYMFSETYIIMIWIMNKYDRFVLPELRENTLFTCASFPLSIHANHSPAVLTNCYFDKMIIFRISALHLSEVRLFSGKRIEQRHNRIKKSLFIMWKYRFVEEIMLHLRHRQTSSTRTHPFTLHSFYMARFVPNILLQLNFSAIALIVYKLINEYKTKHCIFVSSN